MQVRPRRSVLYMPGPNERALDKAKTIPADSLILDLEDSVAPEAKDAARASVCAAVKAGGYGRRELVIRPNAIETAWGMDDLRAAASVAPDAILVPKVAQPGDIVTVAEGAGLHRRAGEDAAVGDDGDAELGAQRARDRGARRRSGQPARLPRHGHQRSR